MKLIAIYNVWGDSTELLKGSIQQIRRHVDCVLLVAQEESNAGELDKSVYSFCEQLFREKLVDDILYFVPQSKNLMKCETEKRQMGIDYAIRKGFTHFLHLDCDEYYESDDFGAVKEHIFRENKIDGWCLNLWTYYKYPTLRLERKENYCVPFIHKLTSNTKCGFAYRGNYFKPVDPTRAVNSKKTEILLGFEMHHFSYVRKDIDKKLRNSTARRNIDNQRVREEYKNAKAGTKLTALYNDTLIEVENIFNIPIWEERV